MSFSALLDHGLNDVITFIYIPRPHLLFKRPFLNNIVATSYPRLWLLDPRQFSQDLCFTASHVMHYKQREGGASLWRMGSSS